MCQMIRSFESGVLTYWKDLPMIRVLNVQGVIVKQGHVGFTSRGS